MKVPSFRQKINFSLTERKDAAAAAAAVELMR